MIINVKGLDTFCTFFKCWPVYLFDRNSKLNYKNSLMKNVTKMYTRWVRALNKMIQMSLIIEIHPNILSYSCLHIKPKDSSVDIGMSLVVPHIVMQIKDSFLFHHIPYVAHVVILNFASYFIICANNKLIVKWTLQQTVIIATDCHKNVLR